MTAADPCQALIDVLSTSKNVLITTHVRPDGDALGTAGAMHLGLRQKGIKSEVLLLSRLPDKYAWVFKNYDVISYDFDRGWPGAFDFDRFDCVLVVDTGTWSQLPGLKERLPKFTGPKLVLDHHLTQEDWATHKHVDSQAAAAGEIAAGCLRRMGVIIDTPIATSLFLAIASDTGWFQFSNTRPQTMRLAADLMEAGVDTDRMYQLLYQNERPQRVALQTRAMSSLELLERGRLAVMRIGKDDFAATQAGVPDTENLINLPLQVATVEVSIVLVEQPEGGPIRVSFRSKGKVDVANFAEQFGGGGHARASGCKIDGTLAAAHDTIVGAMRERLSQNASAVRV